MGGSILKFFQPSMPQIPPKSIAPPPPAIPKPEPFSILPDPELLKAKKQAASEGTSSLLIPILNNPI